ncbi:glycosyltransferase [Vibrio vulnificus]|uniref:glycosyltransferase family 2 protein n=1 Tax=Vibrio vulnificus TaxID=672 RepID=UPI004059BC18
MSVKGKVSILSANFNNGPFLVDFFQSIACQSYRNIELVFVDDASTDSSDAIVLSILETFPFRVNYIKLEENVGFAAALNIGLKECEGDFIARIDPDDIMSSERINKQVGFLKNNPDISIVGSNVQYFKDSLRNIVGSSNFKSEDEWIRNKYFSAEYGMMHGTLMFRKSTFFDIEYHQDEVPAEDYALLARMIKKEIKGYNLNETLTFVRIHSSSVSNELPITTITKLFILRRDILGIDFLFHQMVFKYLHFKYYRKYLYAESYFLRVLFLSLSAFFSPYKSILAVLNKIRF